MKKLVLILMTVWIVGCNSNPTPMVKTISVARNYPSSLLVKCDDYQRYTSSDMKELIIEHADNMEKAIICKDKHNQLVDIISSK